MGLVVDYALLHVGVPPGSAALTGAVMAVGLKNGAQGGWEARKARKRLDRTASRLEELILRNENPPNENPPEVGPLVSDLRGETELWRTGLTSNEKFEQILAAIADKYRNVGKAYPAAA